MIKALRQKYVKSTSKLANALSEFFYGQVYLCIISAITILAYCLDQSFFGLSALCVFAIITLLLYKDLTPFMPLPMVVLLLVRNLNMFLEFKTYIPLFFVFIALIIHFTIYPLKLKKGKLYLPLILVSIALLTGGLFADNIFSYYHLGLVSRLGTGALILFVYYLFINGICPPKNFDLKVYIAYILVHLGLICFFELSVYEILLPLKANGLTDVHIGWNNVNGVASLLLFTIPASFYLLVKEKKVLIHALVVLLSYRAIYITGSDGCLGVSLVAIPILTLFAYIKTDGKTKLKIIALVGFVFVLACLYVFQTISQAGSLPLIDKIKENIFFDNGRTPTYIQALKDFAKYPIFGIGIGYNPNINELETDLVIAFNYHSTFFHVLATMGIVGILAYCLYFIKRYQILMHNTSAFNTFAFLSFTLCSAYGFIDTVEFNVVPLMLIIIITFCNIEYINKNPSLPLA